MNTIHTIHTHTHKRSVSYVLSMAFLLMTMISSINVKAQLTDIPGYDVAANAYDEHAEFLNCDIDFKPAKMDKDRLKGAKENNIALYPNPARDRVNIESAINREVQLQIVDIMGKKMSTTGSSIKANASFSMDTQNWPSGVYILRVIQGGAVISNHKLVVNH